MSQTKPFFIPQKEFDLLNQMNEELIDEIVGQSVDIYKVNIDKTDSNLYGESTIQKTLNPININIDNESLYVKNNINNSIFIFI